MQQSPNLWRLKMRLKLLNVSKRLKSVFILKPKTARPKLSKCKSLLSVTALLLLGALALTGCAPQPLTLTIPQSLKEPCKSGDTATVKTTQDLAIFSLRQEAEIMSCDAKRQGLVDFIEGKKQ